MVVGGDCGWGHVFDAFLPTATPGTKPASQLRCYKEPSPCRIYQAPQQSATQQNVPKSLRDDAFSSGSCLLPGETRPQQKGTPAAVVPSPPNAVTL